MLATIVGHVLFGCACQHARAAANDSHRSGTIADQTHRSGPSRPAAPAIGSMTIAAACTLCGEQSESVPHPCEDNCCTFVKSSGVQMSGLTSSDLNLPVRSPSLTAACRPERGQMQNADAAPTGRSLSADSREWLATWLL